MKMMTRTILLFILISGLSLCKAQILPIDSTIVCSDTATVMGEKFKAVYKTDEFLYIYDSNNKLVYGGKPYYPDIEFIDFNNDGYKDVMIHYPSGNVSGVSDLILFDSNTKLFKRVSNLTSYPDPKPICGTKYYYSYRRSGCADMDWDSNLFYIEEYNKNNFHDYSTIRIGSISGRGCIDSDVKPGIYVYKVKNGWSLLNTMSIDTLKKYNENKWDFIQDYWSKNYHLFE
jgi:hypothetical protein